MTDRFIFKNTLVNSYIEEKADALLKSILDEEPGAELMRAEVSRVDQGFWACLELKCGTETVMAADFAEEPMQAIELAISSLQQQMAACDQALWKRRSQVSRGHRGTAVY